MRTFEFRDEKSNKFWTIDLKGNTFTVTYGKIGSKGQEQTKEFADEAKARKEYDKLIAEKTSKGYIETTAGGGGAPAPASPVATTSAEGEEGAAPKAPAKKKKAPAKAEEEPAAPPPPIPAGVRSFVFTDDKSNKFWNIELKGNTFTVTYGKVGSKGQESTKEFADEAKARKEYDKLVAEKVSKGYVETTAGGASSAAAPAAPAATKTTAPAEGEEEAAPVKAPAKKKAPAKAAAEEDEEDAPATATATATATAPAPTGMRTFEFSDAKSNKFWNIKLEGNTFTVQYGKIGSKGQEQTKEFADEAKARKEYDKLIAEKTGKGYVETTGR